MKYRGSHPFDDGNLHLKNNVRMFSDKYLIYLPPSRQAGSSREQNFRGKRQFCSRSLFTSIRCHRFLGTHWYYLPECRQTPPGRFLFHREVYPTNLFHCQNRSTWIINPTVLNKSPFAPHETPFIKSLSLYHHHHPLYHHRLRKWRW